MGIDVEAKDDGSTARLAMETPEEERPMAKGPIIGLELEAALCDDRSVVIEIVIAPFTFSLELLGLRSNFRKSNSSSRLVHVQ